VPFTLKKSSFTILRSKQVKKEVKEEEEEEEEIENI